MSLPAVASLPPCPPWCISDHEAEDTITPILSHRPHLSQPMTLKPPSGEVVTLVTRDDVLVSPDPTVPSQWGMGTPQVRLRVQRSWLVLRSSQDLVTVCLLLDDLRDWPREQIQRLHTAGTIAWPEWITQETYDRMMQETYDRMMRRFDKEGASRV